jgi:hypothetical protein
MLVVDGLGLLAEGMVPGLQPAGPKVFVQQAACNAGGWVDAGEG